MSAIIILFDGRLSPAAKRQSIEVIKSLLIVIVSIPQRHLSEILTIRSRPEDLLPHVVTRVDTGLPSILRDGGH